MGLLARQSRQNERIEDQLAVWSSGHLSGSLPALRKEPDPAQGSDRHGSGLHVSGWHTGSTLFCPRRIQGR